MAEPLVVTVSASYGAGGSVIAPRLAERLGVTWLDRLVTPATAQHSAESLSEAEERNTPGSRLFVYLARAAGVNAIAPPDAIVDPDDELRSNAEKAVTDMASGGGVLLGRAGAAVLAGRRNTFHVRLDGPVERRIKQAAAIEKIDVEQARKRQAATDKARTHYVKRLYNVDPLDPALYHLVLDTTVLPVDAVVDLLARAAEAFAARPGW